MIGDFRIAIIGSKGLKRVAGKVPKGGFCLPSPNSEPSILRTTQLAGSD
jgi:hypothetical protein